MTNTDHQKPRDQRHRTTLYLDADLTRVLKEFAAESRRPVNALIVDAVNAWIAAHATTPKRPVAVSVQPNLDPTLRRDLQRLGARVARLEALSKQPGVEDRRDDARPILNADAVRREARTVILACGRPVPHRELLDRLESRFILPGRNPSENLRTILVHPKAKGFVLIKNKGYDIVNFLSI